MKKDQAIKLLKKLQKAYTPLKEFGPSGYDGNGGPDWCDSAIVVGSLPDHYYRQYAERFDALHKAFKQLEKALANDKN